MKKTAEEIALDFSEKFQKHYPKKPLFGMMDELANEIKKYGGSQLDAIVIKPVNWHLILQGLRSYKATYKRLGKDNLLEEYELHEYDVINEAIAELEKIL